MAVANELAAREANRQLEVFLSIVCHELKTLLTIMHGSLQLAEHKMHRIVSEEPARSGELAPD